MGSAQRPSGDARSDAPCTGRSQRLRYRNAYASRLRRETRLMRAGLTTPRTRGEPLRVTLVPRSPLASPFGRRSQPEAPVASVGKPS